MIKDIRARAPYYVSDWTDAWNYRVVPATWVCTSSTDLGEAKDIVYIFCECLSRDRFFVGSDRESVPEPEADEQETTGQYGVQEVLLSSVRTRPDMTADIVYGSIFRLNIRRSTTPHLRRYRWAISWYAKLISGPITVFNKVIYDIIESRQNPPVYLHFIGWVYLWGAIFHWIVALGNGVSLLRYVTRFSCDTFGFYVSGLGEKADLRSRPFMSSMGFKW